MKDVFASRSIKTDHDYQKFDLFFEIELREDNGLILEEIKATLGCGNIYHLTYDRYDKWRPHAKYKVSNFADIPNKITPFFKKYPLQAKKQYSFEKFCYVADLIKSRQHPTSEGIATIQALRHKDSLDALDAHV